METCLGKMGILLIQW